MSTQPQNRVFKGGEEPLPTVLWWGRSHPEYSRNRMVRDYFSAAGWRVTYFHPRASELGTLEAYLRRLQRPALIWVPCFRQRDIGSAAHWAQRWQVPMVVDPLISAYEKEVFERRKFPPDSRRARRRRRWEARLLAKPDLVVADTPAHAEFFRQELGVAAEKLCVLYVGAETSMFRYLPPPPLKAPFEVLFFGSYQRVQGVEVIVEAARMTADLPLKWVLLGDELLQSRVAPQVACMDQLTCEPWIAYERLPARLSRAHLLLGIFGDTRKADLVIPNKIFQSMAAGRPLITRAANAYPAELAASGEIGWVPAGDPAALASRVRQYVSRSQQWAQQGQATRGLFDRFFSPQQLLAMFENILRSAGRAGPIRHGGCRPWK